MPTWNFPPDGVQFILDTKTSGQYRVFHIVEENDETITFIHQGGLYGDIQCQVLKEDIVAVSYKPRPLADSLERMVQRG